MSMFGLDLNGVWLDSVDHMGLGLVRQSGWDDLSDAKYNPDPRPRWHGDFDPGVTWGDGLSISVDGRYRGRQEQALAAMGQLRALRGLGRTFMATFHRPRGTTRRRVELRSVTVSHESWQEWADFHLSLIDHDATLLGEERTLSCGVPTHGGGILSPLASPVRIEGSAGDPGRVEIVNEGSMSAPLLMRVSGGLSQGVRLHKVETGEAVELDWPILDGQTVILDSAGPTVMLDNQSDISGRLVQDSWFDASPVDPVTGQPGVSTIQFTPLGEISGNPMLSVTTASTWY